MDEVKKLIEETRARTIDILKFSNDDEERGLELHKKSLVVDSLYPRSVMPYSERMVNRAKEMVEEGRPLSDIMSEMDKMGAVDTIKDSKTRDQYIEIWRSSGVTCSSRTLASNTLQDAITSLSKEKYRIDKLRDVELLATCTDDIKQAKQDGRHAILWNFQNTTHLGGSVNVDIELDNIDIFYGLGVRVMQLTYNLRNFVGDGCTERYESGLSYFGVRVVERMNELGMLVDTSHCGYQTTLDAVEVSKVPLAATHTTCKAVYPHNRGKTDEELKAIAEKGGYIGITQIPAFLGGKGTIKEFLDHVDYAVELVGVDHIGIGSDNSYPAALEPEFLFEMRRQEGGGLFPYKKPPSGRGWWGGWRPEEPKARAVAGPEMRDDEDRRGSLAWINWPYFTVGLVTRGYSEQEIKGIIGANFVNLLKNVIG